VTVVRLSRFLDGENGVQRGRIPPEAVMGDITPTFSP